MVEKTKSNNLTIALNILYAKKEKVYLVYVSKHNSNGEKQVILLMIPNGKRWHYLAVKILPAFLRGIMSKHLGDFYCLNCLHSFATESKFESHIKVYENIDFCNVVMPSEDAKILKFNQYQKSDKALYTGILVWAPKKFFLSFLFQLYFNKKFAEVAVNDFIMHLIILKWLRIQKCRQKRIAMRQSSRSERKN